jgi:hypothetical protein
MVAKLMKSSRQQLLICHQLENITRAISCKPGIIKRLSWLLAILSPILCESALADWVCLCDHGPQSSSIKFAEQYFKANGESYWLLLLSNPDDQCECKQLDVDAEEISWLGLISPEKSARIDKRIILQGDHSEDGIRVSEIIADRPEKPFDLSNTLGVAQNLVDDFSIRSFGIEQRAAYTVENQRLKLQCRAGHKPAGILFDASNKKLSSNHKLELVVSYSSKQQFQLGMADDKRYNQGEPVIFSLPVAQESLTMEVPYAKLDMSQNIHWSLICPADDAEISISNFELLLSGNRRAVSNHDMWIWRAESWRQQGDRLFALLSKYNANRVFISVEMDESQGEVLHIKELHEFIAEANHRAIAVWAVEGDPHATLPKGREQFVRRAKILQQYNLNSTKDSRLAGVQYDIEPYLVKGWSLDQEKWFSAYVETLQQINRQLNAPIEIAIPFWWQFKSVNNEALLDAVAPYIDSVNVMDYRTDVELIRKFAQPVLEWGLQANKKISIALEAGPVADERRWHYRKHDSGSLLHLKQFSQPVLIVLGTEKNSEVADTFSLYHEGVLAGDVVSFQKDPARLIEMLPQLELLWSQWPSFAGISLHGYEHELF